MTNRVNRHVRRARAKAAAGLTCLVLLLGAAAGGCSTHDVAVSRPCTIVKAGKAVALSNRGAVAMAKIGLTPRALKAQEKCDEGVAK
jgi:hypothetical protein